LIHALGCLRGKLFISNKQNVASVLKGICTNTSEIKVHL
jgi:hypothetical protein